MGARLPKSCRHVVEFDWWDRLSLGDLSFTFVPAQHWYRRGAFDLNRVLWGGWVVSGGHQIYHSGDTGFFPGFEAIGRMIPGIDVALLPLGAYEPRWFMGPQHMEPKDALRAYELVGAKHFFGMHWGTFDLSDEPLDGGVGECRRLKQERSYPDGRIHILRPGGALALRGDEVSETGPYNGSKQAGSSPSAASAAGESASS
jgi:L-ascorbate metabolism protein UlaG (beta-lactamase superfamily)